MNLFQHIKEKYLGDTDVVPSNPFVTEYVNSFDNVNLNKLLNKAILVETTEGTYFGTFGKFKGKWALYEDTFVKNIIVPENIVKVICENVKIIIDKPEKKRKHPHTIVDNSDGDLIQENYSINKDTSLLLRDRLKTRFFGSITEEVVNKDNEFSMSPAEIRDRDRRADAMLRSKKFNPKLKNGDTKEEAAHRIATGQVIAARSGNGYKGADLFSSREGLTRKQRKGAKRQLQGGKEFEKREKAITKKSKTGGNRKTPARNREEADEQTRRKKLVTNRRTVANIPGTQGATFKQGKAARERGDAKTAYAATNPGLFQ